MEIGSLPTFENPQEEIKFLRQEIAKKEEEVISRGEKPDHEKIAHEKIDELQNAVVTHPGIPQALVKKEVEAIVLNLSPETHDDKMGELLGILQEQGIFYALKVLDGIHNPHLEDDFHRLLVQYLRQGFPVKGLKNKSPLEKSLQTTLFEVSLPEEEEEEGKQPKELKVLISKMEQFYAGMLSISSQDLSDDNCFSIEIANANGSPETIFYVSVPTYRASLFQKQMLSVFPDAKIRETSDDFNIFNEGGVSLGSYATSGSKPIFPLKTYEDFDYDPLNVILNAFSKIKREGEGASLQVIFKPAGNGYAQRYKMALEEIHNGIPVKRATALPETVAGHVFDIAKDIFYSDKKREADKKKHVDDIAVEQIKKKLESQIVEINIRVMASGASQKDAETVLHEVESAFNQFNNAQGNHLVWKHVEGSKLFELEKDFTFRIFSPDLKIPLNIRELTSILHFPQKVDTAPELRQAKAGTAPAPMGLSEKGTLLGINKNRNTDTKVFMTAEDRLRHMYVIGQTGTGKTTLLKNMITQDILNGEGVCFIDPHGSDIQDILSIIPKERYEDVIYFDPASIERPMALNMLEYDRNYPEQKTFVVNELFSIFQKLYGANPESMGPMFEQYFRNATMLVIEDPDSGSTLLEVSRVMANKAFRELKLSRCKNPVVVQFWREVADKAGGEASLANIVPYITSKFDVFLANEIMRPIIAQEKSSFNFRDVMDNKKILLVNLSKGRLGDINANLIGLILVGKILMAALSRVDSFGKDLPNFYLYIDEFQNVTTNSIAQILSEARKYKLSLTVAHQFIAQLEDDIKDAVFGNVGSIATFRVGAEDAEYLVKQFEPVFTQKDIMNLDNHNAYLKLLSGGKPLKPFNIETLAPPKGNLDIVPKLKELSYLKFGRPREEVEEEVMKKYAKAPVPTAPVFHE